MKKSLIALLGIILLLANACSGNKKESSSAVVTESDSVAYVIGMNIGRNLLEIDSTLNIRAVCEGLRDCFARQERFTYDEARALYLHYHYISKPEARVAYEKQFLEEITQKDRSYARSKSGLTYAVGEVGNVDRTPRSSGDSLTMLVVGKTLDGRTFYSSFERGDSLCLKLGALGKGLQEAVKLIGSGGRINCYLPSELGFGAEGCDSLGIQPNSTLYYEIELLEVTRASRRGDNRRNSLEF